jgi:hypothetical protein
VAEKRTFKVLSVRTVDEEARADCVPSEIAQLYAAYPRLVVEGVGSRVPIDLKDGYSLLHKVSRCELNEPRNLHLCC